MLHLPLRWTPHVLLFLAAVCLGEDNQRNETGACPSYSVDRLWSSSLRQAPLASSPLLLDIDGDSYRDIVVSTQSGEVWAVHGENGHVADNWPFFLEDRSFLASPLTYDLDADGELDIVLTTTDAEILFLRLDGTLFHGETIKIPSLRVKREWYVLDPDYSDRLAEELLRQVPPARSSRHNSTSYSEFDQLAGDQSDPLYSRRQPKPRLSGVDPSDRNYVFVDPHVLATPAIGDLDADGKSDEMVVPVSYYFDAWEYGYPQNLDSLGLEKPELVNYAASSVVVISLVTGEIVAQKFLGITKVGSSQPAYLLASPTVVRLAHDDPVSVVLGTASGELHVLHGIGLTSPLGFPLYMNPITAQVAVGDLVGDDALELVVGDYVGNVVCADHRGQRLWEHEAKQSVDSSVRFADLHHDGSMEVVFSTMYGTLWVLNGTTGLPVTRTPLHLKTAVQSSPLLMTLTTDPLRVAAVVPSVEGLHVFDMYSGCIDRVASEPSLNAALTDHIDPFNEGMELLVTSLSGNVHLYSTGFVHRNDGDFGRNTWPSEVLGYNGFAHKEDTFSIECGRGLSTRDATGATFEFGFTLNDNGRRFRDSRPRDYRVRLTIGRRFTLLDTTLTMDEGRKRLLYTPNTPPIPHQATMVLEVCNMHLQCDSVQFSVRFNLLFESYLQWCLALPFLSLVAGYLWLLRNENTVSLPTTVYKTSKTL